MENEAKLSLEDIEKMNVVMLSPQQVADCIGCSAQGIRDQAKANPAALGFAVTVTGDRIRIPRLAFLHFMKYGAVHIQKR